MTPKEERNVPISRMFEESLGCKWSVGLLQLIKEGFSRPSQFLKNCPGLSAKVMNERLKKMVAFGILERKVKGDKPPLVVEYKLTPFGSRFSKIIDEIKALQEFYQKENKKTKDF